MKVRKSHESEEQAERAASRLTLSAQPQNSREKKNESDSLNCQLKIALVPLTCMGASSPVTVQSCTVVGSSWTHPWITSGHISVTINPVSTKAMHGTPSTRTGMWQMSPTEVLPTTTADPVGTVALSATSGRSGATPQAVLLGSLGWQW
ncbi:UNVERIFIED_CONTAM: hypothetical protein FKN15_033629 [Acipenser sinensis]